MRQMMQRMDALQKQVDAMSKANAPDCCDCLRRLPRRQRQRDRRLLNKRLRSQRLKNLAKGFYGTLDVSTDYVTKGISELGAYSFSYVDPANPKLGFVQGAQKGGPVGRVGLAGGSVDQQIGATATAVPTPSRALTRISFISSRCSPRSLRLPAHLPAIRSNPMSPRPASAMATPLSVSLRK